MTPPVQNERFVAPAPKDEAAQNSEALTGRDKFIKDVHDTVAEAVKAKSEGRQAPGLTLEDGGVTKPSTLRYEKPEDGGTEVVEISSDPYGTLDAEVFGPSQQGEHTVASVSVTHLDKDGKPMNLFKFSAKEDGVMEQSTLGPDGAPVTVQIQDNEIAMAQAEATMSAVAGEMQKAQAAASELSQLAA